MRARSVLRQLLAATLCALLVAPAYPSESVFPRSRSTASPTYDAKTLSKTRVWGSNEKILLHFRATLLLSEKQHWGYEKCSWKNVVGSGVTYDYDAFGNLTHSSTTLSTPTLNNYLFAGEQFDPDLNLYYNRARYLNVSTGRFWTMDDFEGIDQDPFSLHKYLYASSDPVNRLDAGGHDDLVETLGGTLPVSIILAAAVTVVLADACVVYADFTGGEGPCGNKNENEGRIRFQLQLGTLYTEPGTPVVTNIDPPGVTILQARTLGLQPLDISARSSVRFPYTRYQWDFFFAVIMMSQDLDRFVPFGYSGFKRSLLSEPIGNSGWRIDMDNLEGTNLRQ